GYNIHIGNSFYLNFNCIILDCKHVDIRDRVMFNPNVEERVKGDELAFPIKEVAQLFALESLLVIGSW
ncbi:17747_t:CDS:2, partial [Acaulospora morrowiae]